MSVFSTRNLSLAKFRVLGLLFSIPLFFTSCCTLAITSETTLYRGRIGTKISDTNAISIFADNLDPGVFLNGKLRPFKPKHPDINGYFLVSGTTPSHTECSHPNHWDNGPLEIYITGVNIQDYHDTISVETLKNLPKLSADSLGIKLGSQEIGIWELPDIALTPK